MDLPQSVSQLRHIARGLSVIPFPKTQTGLLRKKNALWKTVKKPCWLAKFSSHWFNDSPKLTLRCTKREKSFAQVKEEMEREMLELFSFLQDVDIPAKMDLIRKFNQKIDSKEICTIQQMRAFFLKAEELAECIKLHLRKNEYSQNFTKDISFDVFEQGFNTKTREEIKSSP